MSPSLTNAPRARDVQDATPFHHVVHEEPLITPIFSAERTSFHPGINRYWSVLEKGAAGHAEVSPEMVISAAENIIGLLKTRGHERTQDGLARFRREFCLGQLESIAALKGNENSDAYMRILLTGDALGRSTSVDSSIRAGVSDLNERHVASLRRRYSAQDGLGEKIVARLTQFHDRVTTSHPGVGVASDRRGEQASNAERLLRQFGEIVPDVRKFLLVIPQERALSRDCEDHVEGIQSRLRTNHFGGVLQLSNILMGDIREGINVLRLLLDRPASETSGGTRRASRRG